MRVWWGVVLVAGACFGAFREYAPVVAVPPIPGKLAVTVCSWNNRPVVMVDSAVLAGPDAEIVLRHEQVHAQRMAGYYGGCWPYLYRFRRDRVFRVREELAAHCAAGRFAMVRNRDPQAMWAYIVASLASDTILSSSANCLFRPQ